MRTRHTSFVPFFFFIKTFNRQLPYDTLQLSSVTLPPPSVTLQLPSMPLLAPQVLSILCRPNDPATARPELNHVSPPATSTGLCLQVISHIEETCHRLTNLHLRGRCKFAPFLVTAAIQHTFTMLIPLPLGPASTGVYGDPVWSPEGWSGVHPSITRNAQVTEGNVVHVSTPLSAHPAFPFPMRGPPHGCLSP